MRKILTLCLLWAYSQACLAQKDSIDTYLKEVVISANRTPQEVMNVSRNVSIISEKDIRSSAFNTPAELLSSKGLYIVGEGQNPGANQSVFLRGANSNHTNILINGLRITDPSTPNSAIDLSELSLANIERIEIIRGSHGAVYGTGGIGGVINIITKQGESGFTGNADFQAGAISNGGTSLSQSAYVNYGKNGFYINGSVFNTNINGIDATVDTVSAGFKTTDEDDFDKTDVSGSVGYKKDNLNIYFNYKRTDQRADIDQGAFQDDDNYFLDFKRNRFQYGAELEINDKWSLTFKGAYTNSERLSLNDSSIIDDSGNYDQSFIESTNQGRLRNHEIQSTFKLSGVDLIAGLGRYDEKMELNGYTYIDGPFGAFESEQSYDSLDLLLVTDYVFLTSLIDLEELMGLNGFSTTLSGRFSSVDNGIQNFTFEVSPSYSFDQSTIYASYAEGFNTPSLTQLYAPNGVFNFTTRGNPNLEEETSRTFEIGLKHLLGKSISMVFSYYNTIVNNSIEYVYLWNGQSSFENLSSADYLGDTYVNVAQQKVQGVEFRVEGAITKKLRFNMDATYLDGSYEFEPDDVDESYVGQNYVQLFNNGLFLNQSQSSDELVRRPSYQVFLGLDYSASEKLSLNGRFRITDARPDVFYDAALGPFGALNTREVESYTLFDISAKYDWSKNVFSLARVENLFDNDYNEINGFNTRGRSIYLKVGLLF